MRKSKPKLTSGSPRPVQKTLPEIVKKWPRKIRRGGRFRTRVVWGHPLFWTPCKKPCQVGCHGCKNRAGAGRTADHFRDFRDPKKAQKKKVAFVFFAFFRKIRAKCPLKNTKKSMIKRINGGNNSKIEKKDTRADRERPSRSQKTRSSGGTRS